MGRMTVLAYSVVCYLVFLGVFLYSIGFVGDFAVPKSIDTGPMVRPVRAVVVDLILLAGFAVPHSVMARPGFKRWWTRLVPPTAERSTYVLVSSLLLALLFWQWRPMPGVVWAASHPIIAIALWALFAVGWAIALLSTFAIDHFDLLGLRQAVLYARGLPYTPPRFRTSVPYRVVRHPLMLGFLIAFWSIPTMTWGHLLFAAVTTAYVLVGTHLEERDLEDAFGANYQEYRRRVPMIVPLPRKRWVTRSPTN